ncbi:MAG: polymerase subunit sigma-70 [Aeromicrobium sp.]|nr:polymerase subunit sigma-70 [Aeromicrobium sp.]
MDTTEAFEAERPRLTALAARVLGDPGEAEDVVQLAWLRLASSETDIASLPAWLTTVTGRLCVDRLRSRVPVPTDDVRASGTVSDPADEVALADSVGVALHVVLERLSPAERVAFVLHDSFGFEFSTIASVLDTTPSAARKLASRARAKVRQPTPEDQLADWEVVDSFMAAAREGDFERLIQLLAPDVGVRADITAVAAGTPEAIDGRRDVAEFFNGGAHAALAVFFGDRPAFAWFNRGEVKVLFDFTVTDEVVRGITFRADPEALRQVTRRDGGERRR